MQIVVAPEPGMNDRAAPPQTAAHGTGPKGDDPSNEAGPMGMPAYQHEECERAFGCHDPHEMAVIVVTPHEDHENAPLQLCTQGSSCTRSVWLAPFGCVEAADPAALVADHDAVAILHPDLGW